MLLTTCPNCARPLHVAQPGKYTCPNCRAAVPVAEDASQPDPGDFGPPPELLLRRSHPGMPPNPKEPALTPAPGTGARLGAGPLVLAAFTLGLGLGCLLGWATALLLIR
jgi:hypothetical protein